MVASPIPKDLFNHGKKDAYAKFLISVFFFLIMEKANKAFKRRFL